MGGMAKSKGPAKRLQPQDEAPRGSDGLFWVAGQLPSGQWHPMFCYRTEGEARRVFRFIMGHEESELARSNALAEYDDFRVQQ